MNIRTPFQNFYMNSIPKKKILLIGGLVYDFDNKSLITNLLDRCTPIGLISNGICVVKNKIYIITANSNAQVNGILEYNVQNDTLINLNSTLFTQNYSSWSSFPAILNDELFLVVKEMVFYGEATGQLRKFIFETNEWSELLCPEIPINSLCYLNGAYWLASSQGNARKCTTHPSTTTWESISTPNPNSSSVGYATPLYTSQGRLYLSCPAPSHTSKSAYLYELVENEFQVVLSWANNGSDPVSFSCLSQEEDFSVFQGCFGSSFPYTENRLYVSLNTEDELIQKNAPDNNYVCSCIRCEDEILVLTATDSTNLNLYKTQDFNTYEPILSNITSNALASKLQLLYL